VADSGASGGAAIAGGSPPGRARAPSNVSNVDSSAAIGPDGKRAGAYVLGLEAGRPGGADMFDLEPLRAISTLVTSNGQEHLLISDGFHAIRLDVLAGTIAAGPARLCYRLSGLASAEPPLLTLRRLLALWRTGRFCRSLHAKEARAGRWVLMLRAHDALAAGANQRELAAELLGGNVARPGWRVEAPSLRSRAQRLVRGAGAMAGGGFRELLR
jgi:hypothetical protein